MKDVADELEENHVHTEKQLQHEICMCTLARDVRLLFVSDLKDVELINREGTITNLHLKIVDQEATITNFRDLVNKLQVCHNASHYELIYHIDSNYKYA